MKITPYSYLDPVSFKIDANAIHSDTAFANSSLSLSQESNKQQPDTAPCCGFFYWIFSPIVNLIKKMFSCLSSTEEKKRHKKPQTQPDKYGEIPLILKTKEQKRLEREAKERLNKRH